MSSSSSKESSASAMTEEWMTGYQLFVNQCLDELKARHPDNTVQLTMLLKMCRDNWKVILLSSSN